MASLSFGVTPDAVREQTVQGLSDVAAGVRDVGERLSGSGTVTAGQAGNALASSAINLFHRRAGAGLSGAGLQLDVLGQHVDVAMSGYERGDDVSAQDLLGVLRGHG